MIVLIFGLFVVWMLFHEYIGIGFQRMITHRRDKKALANLETKKVEKRKESQVALFLKVEYDRLPADYRPALDLDAALAALDFKYGITKANNHFRSEYDRYYKEWSGVRMNQCLCRSAGCREMPEYKNIYDSIEKVRRALVARSQAEAKRRHDEELAGMEWDLKTADEIVKELNDSATIITEVTQELNAR